MRRPISFDYEKELAYAALTHIIKSHPPEVMTKCLMRVTAVFLYDQNPEDVDVPLGDYIDSLRMRIKKIKRNKNAENE